MFRAFPIWVTSNPGGMDSAGLCITPNMIVLIEQVEIQYLKDGVKQRFDEILETINSRDSLFEEFDEQIFMRWLRSEILTPAHFVFELKSGMRVEEIQE